MAEKIVECVPNFSEGRDPDIIDQIAKSGDGIAGARVLGVEPDADYNRTVLTIAGTPDAVFEAAFKVIMKAQELIDICLLYTSPSPRDGDESRMPSSA